MRVAIATCLELPEPDVDEPLLLAALEEAGIDAQLVAWDSLEIDWSSFGLTIVRSTWNYPEHPTEFAAWIELVGHQTRLLNPGRVMAGNIDKRYLDKMRIRGIETVPSEFFARGTKPSLGFPSDIVIKPCISAGSWLTERFSAAQAPAAEAFLHEHLKSRDIMVQPYIASVERGGEIAWIWIDGQITHGVQKHPRFGDGFELVSEAVFPTRADKELVERILEGIDCELLYARIDLMDHEGRWLLSELELIEPSLYFKQHPPALTEFVRAVQHRIASAS